MLPILSGTIHNAGRLLELENKWQQKKENGKIFAREMTPEERQLEKYQEDMKQIREGNVMSSISAKLMGGQNLTNEEIEYLKKNCPDRYREYQEIKREREAYERQLKNCKTKEDVERLKLNKMGNLAAEAKAITNNPNIPKDKKRELLEKLLKKTMGVQDIHMNFVKSSKYRDLPTDEEISEEVKEKADRTESAAKGLGAEESEKEAGSDGSDKGTDGKPDLSEPAKEADEVYEELKAGLADYLTKDRPKGYGLEYFAGGHIVRS